MVLAGVGGVYSMDVRDRRRRSDSDHAQIVFLIQQLLIPNADPSLGHPLPPIKKYFVYIFIIYNR